MSNELMKKYLTLIWPLWVFEIYLEIAIQFKPGRETEMVDGDYYYRLNVTCSNSE